MIELSKRWPPKLARNSYTPTATIPRQTTVACSEATDWATATHTPPTRATAWRAPGMQSDQRGGALDVPTAHDVQRAMQDGNKCAHVINRYSNETTNSTGNSDIIHVCRDTTEFANGKNTTSAPPNNTVRIMSAGDTVPPVTANDDGHVRSRNAHSRQDDSLTGSAEETTEAGEEEAATGCSTEWTTTVNLQTQQQDNELANIIDYLQNGNLPEDSKIARRIALTKDQFTIRENVLYHLGTNRRKNNSANQQIMEHTEAHDEHCTSTIPCTVNALWLRKNVFNLNAKSILDRYVHGHPKICFTMRNMPCCKG